MARILATAALIAAIALVALALFGGGDSYQVKVVFENAGQLVKGNEVRVGGQPVGSALFDVGVVLGGIGLLGAVWSRPQRMGVGG